MDVLNSIKLTIPPELREMLLEFVICYLIDRPTDPYSYASAHFLYQQNLRHSYIVRYPYSETAKAAASDESVQTPVTPESQEETEAGEEGDEVESQEKVWKAVRIAEDDETPSSEKEEDVAEVAEKEEDVAEVAEKEEDVAEVVSEVLPEASVSQDEGSSENALHAAARSVLHALVDEMGESEEAEAKLVPELSAKAIAARSVVELLHSAYHSVKDLHD